MQGGRGRKAPSAFSERAFAHAKGERRVKKIILWLLFCAALGVVVFAFRPRLFLTAENEKGEVVLILPVYEGERYTVRFIHSVARTPVDEIYEIAPDCSILRETVYDMMGAGLPYEPLDGQTFTTENGKYRISGFDMHIPALTYRINMVVADHTLLIGRNEYPLRRYASGAGKPLTFRVRRLAPYEAVLLWRRAREAKMKKGES